MFLQYVFKRILKIISIIIILNNNNSEQIIKKSRGNVSSINISGKNNTFRLKLDYSLNTW